MQGYADRTGHPHRWPDVLDRWSYWDDPGSVIYIHDAALPKPNAATLARHCRVTHLDLIAVLHGVLANIDLDDRTIEDDHVLANVLDAVLVQQLRLTTMVAEARLPHLQRLTKPRQFTLGAPYRGACDARVNSSMQAMMMGLFKRTVV